ncbi:Phosphoribosylamine--glycine ligase [Prochlorococcus marinus str. MIT 9321]|uniref:Phosphoribosylamine--glycine ligase n=1 Tax=Prochlorococcus marinus str. MIT 9401 TaxID=167551 RepID=A0A0A2B8P0_PROMR|nr:phosphoribosylamine--glycine ligase [Prochlorococcus marinus]KGG02738.1 Phosphoribosylamine--glycine ligase [Prochlorococcus marinus str. MIT 9321]KGG05372.1 Phosphoribosylamine--glycine ligase [Prochlorococcus marinus str. MIT 9322]KGG10433.1 Phosphoribosylamine--glycine ligase [Prochlorococcus marinus str. MIT 9401]
MHINSTSSKSFNRLENILIIGNGGRENSLAWVIQKNELVKKVYLIPGNAGSERINKCERIKFDINNQKKLIEKLNLLKIDLIVIGPEIPLANGLADFLRGKDFKVFGPGKDGAKLEYSKSWAKEFMQEAKIPTANFWKVNSLEEAQKIINSAPVPLVVKADGLASGKGVYIPDSKNDCLRAAESIFNGKFGDSGNVVVLEEKIQGPEVSVFALCDGKRYVLLPTAQDHKRLNEKDKGPNTGGMGAYSPAPLLTKDNLDIIIKEIIEPTINQLNKKNIEYKGVIYFGLMITKSGPKVIEYNCRFGDPECQTIMPLMDQSFVLLLEKCSMGNLTGDEKINTSDKVSGCVIATSKGYPNEYKTGFPIKIGKVDSSNCQIFDSGTSLSKNGELITDGGRVLSIVCQDKDFDLVFEKAYKNLKEINFDGIYFRNDIGHQVRKKLSKGN